MASGGAHRLTGLRAATTLVDLGFAPIASGVIARRKPAMALLERTHADTRATERIHQLRREFGRGPVELVLPGRRVVVVLAPEDVGRVLEQAPEPFDPANREKRASLGQFQPHGVLVSRGPVRQQRRTINETALDTDVPLHRLATPFAAAAVEETDAALRDAVQRGHLDGAQFTIAWWRLVRRVVFGERAREDHDVTDQLWRLRSAANWSFLAPPHRGRRDRFVERLYDYASTAEPDSLAGALAATPTTGAADPVGQIPHWLFAFDAAGIALTRALALLATHPDQHERALADTMDPQVPETRHYLRACVLESLRLWPTTPAILRETTAPTRWREGSEQFIIRTGAALAILTPAFHRDPELLPFADEFVPDIWLDGRAEQCPQLVPFSAGPARCPGRDLVLFLTSTVLAQLLRTTDFRLQSQPPLSPHQPLPKTYNNFGVDLGVRARSSSPAEAIPTDR